MIELDGPPVVSGREEHKREFSESRRALVERIQQRATTTPSRGLGDTIASLTAATGLDELAALYTSITGRDCGCKDRQEALNKLFPYRTQDHS